MSYQIEDDDAVLGIRVDVATERQPAVLAALQDCQDGRCGCPTDQYERLAAMQVQPGENTLLIRLQPKPGQRLDPEALRACLDYTLDATLDADA